MSRFCPVPGSILSFDIEYQNYSKLGGFPLYSTGTVVPYRLNGCTITSSGTAKTIYKIGVHHFVRHDLSSLVHVH